MNDAPIGLVDIVDPAGPQPPWDAGLLILLLGVALLLLGVFLLHRRRSRSRVLRRVHRGLATGRVAPRLAALQIDRLVRAHYRLRHLSPQGCPQGIDARAWRQWVTALQAMRFGRRSVADPQVVETARGWLRRAR